MLAVSGERIILLSTPFGRRGFFHKEWQDGMDWQKVKITANDCPRIDKGWLMREQKMIGDFWFKQEYECLFLETSDQIFSYEDINAALDPNLTPLFQTENLQI